MNVLRQNSDYALRMMGNLAANYTQRAVSVRMLSQEEDVSYQFACKILQELHRAGLVKSEMGAAGGYQLCRAPEQITMLDVVKAMQGDIAINHCTNIKDSCSRQSKCKVSQKLCQLQDCVEEFLADVTLQDLL